MAKSPSLEILKSDSDVFSVFAMLQAGRSLVLGVRQGGGLEHHIWQDQPATPAILLEPTSSSRESQDKALPSELGVAGTERVGRSSKAHRRGTDFCSVN